MEGVPTGPWQMKDFDVELSVSTMDGSAPLIADLVEQGDAQEPGHWGSEYQIGQWIARCSPAGISTLLDALSSQSLSLSEAREEIERLREALTALANARALRGVREVVAGWNGEGRADGPYPRHDARLGATLPKTNCGAVYELDEAMTNAKSALENSKARLADAPSKSPDPDLLRKGAEVEMLLQAYDEKTELVPLGHENVSLGASTYGWRKAVVKQLRELHAALVSGSREEQS